MDTFLLLIGFQGQRTKELKSPDDSNNLYEPVLEDTRIDGDYSNLVIPSVTDWLARNPTLQWSAKAFGIATLTASAAALALLATQVFNNEG
jgi:hypothetical protein